MQQDSEVAAMLIIRPLTAEIPIVQLQNHVDMVKETATKILIVLETWYATKDKKVSQFEVSKSLQTKQIRITADFQSEHSTEASHIAQLKVHAVLAKVTVM